MHKEGYYSSGEFAKKANVTVRTIRYYDNKGVLSPSSHNSSGHRLYTESDFIKLKRILPLSVAIKYCVQLINPSNKNMKSKSVKATFKCEVRHNIIFMDSFQGC